MEDNARRNKETEVRVDNELLKALAKNTNTLNTIGGGMATTKMEIYQSPEEGYMIQIKTPGVTAEAYNIEINRDQLVVYTTLPEQREVELEVDDITPFFKVLPITSSVDVDRIEAVFENGTLQIIAPFREDWNTGKIRRVDIRHF